MARGVRFSEAEVKRVIHLLKTTEMPMPRIAKNTGMAPNTIAEINTKYNVRIYIGRARWTVDGKIVDVSV